MMIPHLLIQIALILVIARCGYVAFNLLNRARKAWLEILFYLAVVVIALNLLL
jgi:predicted membrane channel-forming protein YqfA (hemolysin III family)